MTDSKMMIHCRATNSDKTDLRREARWLKALASESRLQIVKDLVKKEKCVTDIQKLMKVRQANISQHLRILRWAGIVEWRTEGKVHCYYLKNPEIIAELTKLLERAIK